jgi:hypothetical protein
MDGRSLGSLKPGGIQSQREQMLDSQQEARQVLAQGERSSALGRNRESGRGLVKLSSQGACPTLHLYPRLENYQGRTRYSKEVRPVECRVRDSSSRTKLREKRDVSGG